MSNYPSRFFPSRLFEEKILIICLILTLSTFHFPQIASAHFDISGAGARGCGMANAFTGLADDVYTLYYNPAGLVRIRRTELAMDYSKLYVGLDDNSDLGNGFMGYVYPLGRRGTLGIAWLNFTLTDYYNEDMFMIGFGKQFYLVALDEMINMGLNFKILTKEFKRTAYTENAVNLGTGELSGKRDPVFDRGYSVRGLSFDMGFLYELDYSHSFALTLKDITEPDMGLDSTDRIIRTTGLGYAYRSDEFNMAVDFMFKAEKLTSTVGMEKWFVDKSYAVRGGLGIGSNEYADVSLGCGYQYNELFEFDYSFVLPLGGISNTYGSHRISLTLRFGGDIMSEFETMRELEETRSKIRKTGKSYDEAVRETDEALDILREEEGAIHEIEGIQRQLEDRIQRLEEKLR